MTDLHFDTHAITEFLVGLLNTPGPTGYYVEGMAYVQAAFESLNIPALSITTTNKGALLATWKGSADDASRGVTAHVDTLGLMVKEIKSEGRIETTQLGGFAWNAVESEGVTVRTHDNRRYRGTLMLVNSSKHVNPDMG
ncbi:MAG TPA: hypothetical protein VJZ27_05915, partial [Aggregatilineales bacterium]|nr:hypothetical protein [Aggregatilineales bacterium]